MSQGRSGILQQQARPETRQLCARLPLAAIVQGLRVHQVHSLIGLQSTSSTFIEIKDFPEENLLVFLDFKAKTQCANASAPIAGLVTPKEEL